MVPLRKAAQPTDYQRRLVAQLRPPAPPPEDERRDTPGETSGALSRHSLQLAAKFAARWRFRLGGRFAEAHFLSGLLRRAWRAWRRAMRLLHLREISAAVLSNKRRFLLQQRCLEAWIHMTRARRRRGRIGALIEARIQRRRLAGVLEAWSWRATLKRRRRNQEHQAGVFFRFRRLSAVMGAWRQAAAEAGARQALLHRALDHWGSRTLSMALTARLSERHMLLLLQKMKNQPRATYPAIADP